ncbi:MAG: DUF4179 domain-containing protein [Clostridiaceae bacterium]
MDKFDELLKEKADREIDYIPDSLDNKINNILNNLPKKKSKKPIIAASLAAIIITTPILSVYGSDVPIIKEIIQYFNNNDKSELIGDKSVYEKYAQKVGITQEDKGVKVTIDGIYCDDNYISVFYTVEDTTGRKLNDNWLHTTISYNVDGKETCETWTPEERILEDGKIQGISRYGIAQLSLPDSFKLNLDVLEAYDTDGNWSFSIDVNKKEVMEDTKVYEPNIEFQTNDIIESHDIKIEKVVMTPLGNQIVISENMDNKQFPYHSFVLYDENNNLLDVKVSSLISGSGVTKNTFEFITGNKEIKSLKLVPLKVYSDTKPKSLDQIIEVNDSFPKEIETDNGSKLTVNKIIKSDKSTEVYFKKENFNCVPWFYLLKENEDLLAGKTEDIILVDSEKEIYKVTLPKAEEGYKISAIVSSEFDLNNIPKEIKTSQYGSIKIVNVEYTEERMKIYYQKSGIVLHADMCIFSNGKDVDSTSDNSLSTIVDKEKGIYLQILPKPKENDKLLVSYDERFEPMFDQAITIPLK